MSEKIIKTALTIMLGALWLAAMISLTGCTNQVPPQTSLVPPTGSSKVSIDFFTDIVKIRNCDYIRSSVHGGYAYVHCADCTNSIHLSSNK